MNSHRETIDLAPGWKGRIASALPFLSPLLYIPVFLILHSVNPLSSIFYGDSNSHAVIARSLFDSSEAVSLGTTWLPVYHLLLAPFCIPDTLFFNFASGFLLNLLLAVICLYMIGKVIASLGMQAEHRIAAILLFGLNPDFIYHIVTPMTEVAFLTFIVISAYFFQKAIAEDSNRHLWLASLFICVSTLTRYEAWFLAPIPLLYYILNALTAKKFNTALFRKMLICLAAFSGIVFWLTYHALYYGGAFRFLQSTKSAGYEPAAEALRFHAFNVLKAFSSNFILMYGPFPTIALLSALILSFRKLHGRENNFLFLFLSAPVFYLLVSLFMGYVQIKDHWNSRYVLSALPLVVLFSVHGLQGQRKAMLRGFIITCIAYYILEAMSLVPIVTFADAKTHIYDRTYETRQIGQYVADSLGSGKVNYIGGSANASHRLILFSGIPLKQYHIYRISDSTSEDLRKPEFAEPWKFGKIIILEYKQAGFGGADIPLIIRKIAETEKHARLVMKTTYFAVFSVN